MRKQLKIVKKKSHPPHTVDRREQDSTQVLLSAIHS